MRLFKLTKSYKSLILMAFVFGAATVAMNLGLQSTSSYLIAKAAQHPGTILLLWTPIVAVRFFGTARAGFRYLDRYFSHDVTLRWLRDLKVHLYQAVEPRMGVLGRGYQSGDVLSRVGSDVDSLQNLLVSLYEPLAIGIIGLLMVLGIGLWLNPPIAISLTLMLALSGVALSWSAARVSQLSSQGLVDLRSRLSAALVQLLHGLSDIRALNLADRVEAHIDHLQERIQTAKRRLSRISGVYNGLSLFISWAGMWVVLQISIFEAERHQLQPVLVPVVALLALASFEIVSPLPAAFQEAGGLKRASQRIEELAGLPDAPQNARRTRPAEEVPSVVLNDVSLDANHASRPILERVSVTLAPGRHVALMGPNGSGKSSLVNLITGLTPFTGGRVTLDHTDLGDWDPEAARRCFSVVNQFPHVFHSTLRANLLLASPNATERELHQAMQLAGMQPLMKTLPDGLDTMLGERGTTLSGGEIKRLAVARAILKNAPILLLDEPTEGLDPLSERSLMEGLMEWARQRSVLWITHGSTNLDLVDEVVILTGGRIIEQGSPQRIAKHPMAKTLMDLALLPE